MTHASHPHRISVAPVLTFAAVFAAVFAVIFAAALPAHAQGCSQCLDSTRSTPPAVQAAYRHAILLLGGFAATLFIAGGLLLARRPR